MDDRAKQFKEVAEAKLKGEHLKKELATLRRFLFRNQDYRFTKAAQSNLYLAVVAHHSNPAALETGRTGEEEPPLLKLLDDALKMPFTVFTSAQKDKILQLYWSVLGALGGDAPQPAPAARRTRDLFLIDIADSSNGALSLMHEDGTEYAGHVDVTEQDIRDELRAALASGRNVLVTVSESADGADVWFVGFIADDE